MEWRQLSLIVTALFLAVPAQADEKEPAAILEIGGTGEWGLPGPPGVGPSAAVEVTVIKEWLEIEAGVARLSFPKGRTEWDTDILFKKPFTLSDKLEFTIGAGSAVGVHPGGNKNRRGGRAGFHALADTRPKAWVVS